MAKINTLEEFGEYIQNNVIVEPNELPKVSQVGWFGPQGALNFIDINKPLPFDRYSIAVAIFHDEETIRIFTFPAAPPSPTPQDWKVRSIGRYTLSRTAPTFVTEAFPSLDVMADAIVEEWNDVAGETGGAEAELEAVIEYLQTEMEAAPTGALARGLFERVLEGLQAGLHHDTDDDEDDEPETAPPTGGVAAGVPITEVAK